MNELIKSLAIKEAYGAHHTKTRVGAVVYQRSRVLGLGSNFQHKTHPKSTHPFGRIHAELAAIIDAMRYDRFRNSLIGTSIYVARLKKDGSLGLAKPCRWCQELIHRVGIKEVTWSVDQ